MISKELREKIIELDPEEELEIKVIIATSMGDHEEEGTIKIERIKTPDYIKITRIVARQYIQSKIGGKK